MQFFRFFVVSTVLLSFGLGLSAPAAVAQGGTSTQGGAPASPVASTDSSVAAAPDTSSESTPSTEDLMPFSGWKVINLPTDRTIGAGNWLFLISHRFIRPVNSGYSGFYGLDGPAYMYLSMGYAITDDLLMTLGRSNERDNVELETRYQIVPERSPDWPVGLAVQGTGNWHTLDRPGASRWRDEAFKFTGQVSLTRTVADQFGLLLVPGLTLNPSTRDSGEAPLLTLGLGARWKIYPKLALVGEWTPILARSERTVGSGNQYDTWGVGVEVMAGGHVFQLLVGNNDSLTADQYLDGGDLDGNVFDGNLRLGFNIFRILDFSKF